MSKNVRSSAPDRRAPEAPDIPEYFQAGTPPSRGIAVHRLAIIRARTIVGQWWFIKSERRSSHRQVPAKDQTDEEPAARRIGPRKCHEQPETIFSPQSFDSARKAACCFFPVCSEAFFFFSPKRGRNQTHHYPIGWGYLKPARIHFPAIIDEKTRHRLDNENGRYFLTRPMFF